MLYSRFKVYLNNGTSYIDGTYGIPKSVEDYWNERWGKARDSVLITSKKVIPVHAITFIEGLEDEKEQPKNTRNDGLRRFPISGITE